MGTDLSGTPQGAGGVGGLLLITDHSALITSHYPTYEGNGNISEYLTSTGAVAGHFEYDAFGNTTVNTDPTNRFPYKFSTKPQDVETGLYYYGYRFYDPVVGRWINRDPVKEKGGLNHYGFIGNSVLGHVDLLGLSTFWDIISTLPFFGTLYNIIVSPAGANVGDYTIIINATLCEIDPILAIQDCKNKVATQQASYIGKYAALNILHEVLDGFGSIGPWAPAFWIDAAVDFFVSL